MDPPTDEPARLQLSRAQFWGVFGVSLAVFFFVTGPVWRHAGDIDVLDGAIGWSYLVIPVLVAGLLLASRRWSLRGFFLDTLALTFTKFVVTATFATVVWETLSPPHPPPRAPAATRSAAPAAPAVPPEPVVVPTPIDPKRTGTLVVSVMDADGRPAPGAVAFVAGGLEAFVFAPPKDAVPLAYGAGGPLPPFAVVQVGQRVEGRSTDGRLHTLRATRDGATLFNVPLLSSGEPEAVRMSEGAGLAVVHCNVHREEPEGRLLVLAHPFWGSAGADGAVVLAGVPAGRLRVGAWLEGRGAAEQAVELGAGGREAVRVVLGR